MSAAAREPRRVVLAAIVLGLALGPRIGALPLAMVLAGAALLCVRLLVLRTLLAAVVVVALAAGAAAGGARVDALTRTALAPGPVTTDATLLEQPRADTTGPGRHALASVHGEPVLLRAGRFAPLPAATGPGVIVRVTGTLRPADRGAAARHAHATLVARRIEPTGRHRGGAAGFVDAVRRRAQRALEQPLPAATGALLSGMVLGQDGNVPPELADAMRSASLSHLTAASGQNVALLVALAVGLGIALGFGVRGRRLLALVLIALYVPLAGAGPPIVRAAVMGTAAIAAASAGRPSSRADALLLAAAVTLTIDPRATGDLGWQLSFAATAGIALLARPITRRLGGLPRPVAAAAAVTVAATLATAPILALQTGQSSLVAIPANLTAVAAVAPVMVLGFGAALIGQISAAAAVPLAWLAGVGAAFVAAAGRFWGTLPAAAVHVEPALVIVACVLALVALLRRPARRAGAALVATAAALLVVAVLTASDGGRTAAPPVAPGTLRATGLDVGQGDATLLQAGGATVLVDTGPPGTDLVAQLRAAGVERIDLLVLTHPQLDHIGGTAALAQAIPVVAALDGRGGDPRWRSLDRPLARTRIIGAVAGTRLRIGPITVDELWPPRTAPEPGADPNDRAVVLVAGAYGRRVLLTADAESNVLSQLSLPAVDLLKVSHHGSRDEGLPEILAALRPRVALIEVGTNNDYGHPSAQALGALAAARVPLVARTDRDGIVRIDLAAAGVSVARSRP